MSATVNPVSSRIPPDPLQQILVQHCDLSESDVAEIGDTQAREALDFGAAAMKLRLVTQEDLEQARAAVMRRQPAQPARRTWTGRDPGPTLPDHATDVRTDQLRSLRTELLLRHDRRQRRANVIAVLSPAAGEGRSQMAADLAKSFARTGQPTLLIDADLRRPSQHARFGQDNRPGLVEAISEQSTPAFRPLDHSGHLFLLTAGGPSDSAAELLSSRSFETLLDAWALQFDHIILDTPPAGAYPDALALGTIARRVLIVSRAQRSFVSGTRDLLRRLEATRAEILGAVLCHF